MSAIHLPEMYDKLPNHQEFTFKSTSFRVVRQESKKEEPKVLKYLEKKDGLNRCLEGNQDSYVEFWTSIEEIKERAIVYINNEDLKPDPEGPVITPPDFQGKSEASESSVAQIYSCVVSCHAVSYWDKLFVFLCCFRSSIRYQSRQVT